METAVDRPTEVEEKVTIDVSMFGEASGFADVTLVVEEVRIPVINALLSLSSPIFREMFQKETKEKNKKEINLPDKTVDTFVLFLRCLYPDLKESVTADNAAAILPLASEYQVVKLMEQCEDCLMILIGDKDNASMPCKSLYSYLKLAEECNRERLMELCVIRISTFRLEERRNNMREFKITAKSDSKIANMACQRHERFEDDIRSYSYSTALIEAIKKANQSTSKKRPFDIFQYLRLVYLLHGRQSQLYKEFLATMEKVCEEVPDDVPKYNDFLYLHEDFKLDLEGIIKSFRKKKIVV